MDDETVQFEDAALRACARLEADPDELARYQAEALDLAEVDVAAVES